MYQLTIASIQKRGDSLMISPRCGKFKSHPPVYHTALLFRKI